MERLINLVGFLFLSVALAAVGYYGINRFYLLRVEEIKSEFEFQCAQAYRYTETLQNGAIVSYPMEKEYKDCVNSKGNLN